MTEPQLAAVTAAAARGFRIDIFEVPALQALADNLDVSTLNKIDAFLESDLGKRMVAADVAEAKIGEANIDKVMNGEITAPSTPKRDALFDKLERATRSAESTVQIFLDMGQAVAVGTAVGSGMDPVAVGERARKSGEASRAGLEENMRLPMRRFMAYGYRDHERRRLEAAARISGIGAGQALRRRLQCVDGRGLQRHGAAHRGTARRNAARNGAGGSRAAAGGAAARPGRRAPNSNP